MEYEMVWCYWNGEAMSFLRFMTLYSLCKYNKNVTLILRTVPSKIKHPIYSKDVFLESNNLEPTFDYTENIYKLKNLKVVTLEEFAPIELHSVVGSPLLADTLKWYVLGEYGGTFSDMDILFFKPVPIINFDIGINLFHNIIPVGFQQGKPNKVFKHMFEIAKTAMHGNHEACGASLTGRIFLENNGLQKYINEGIIIKILEERLVYPFVLGDGYYNISARSPFYFLPMILPPECIGIHWYGGVTHYIHTHMTHLNYTISQNIISCLIYALIKDETEIQFSFKEFKIPTVNLWEEDETKVVGDINFYVGKI
jgi:hypothetical protein